MLVLRTLLTLICIFWSSLSLNAAANELERTNYGNTHLPIWSELSFFERDTLGKLAQARNNDPDALLALYVLASGEREYAAFEAVNRRVHALMQTLNKQLLEPDNTLLAGDLINRAMHHALFLQEGQGKAPSGYATEQSRLMGVFETGEFNCISSALLYIVLARHLDLQVQGVLLPSHAFVELATDKGAVDVETTSINGFNQAHNADFYQTLSTQWHEVRGLDTASYQDYLNRKKVSPTLLGAKNMLNQHTSSDLMPFADGARLAEISAFINPLDSLAQEKRLIFYNHELQQLSANKAWPTLLRLFATTYSQVLTDAEEAGRPEAIVGPMLYYQLGALSTYAHSGDEEKTFAVLNDIMLTHPAIPEQQDNIELELAQGVWDLATELVSEGLYQRALDTIPTAQMHLPEHEAWPKLARWVFAKWVEGLWQQQQWQEVVFVATDWLEHPTLEGDDPQALEVLARAHQNLVAAALNNGEQETAKAHVEMCELSLPAQACGAARKLLLHHSKS